MNEASASFQSWGDAPPGDCGTADPLRVPDHELLGPIASGAYGEVWLGRNVVGTLRAVKVVRRDQHTSGESFEREFNGLQKFEPVSRSHEGLVDVLTLGLLPGDVGFYYVMELADTFGVPVSAGPGATGGEAVRLKAGLQAYSPRTLRAELKSRGALPADEVIVLGLKLTAALAHLHAQGLVHRDVKPSNILFIGGEPKLADAGLVAAVDDARSLVGTAGYIAPEGPGTPQADLYALGKVLYEAAFGKDRQEFPALPADVATRPDHARLLELNALLLKACATNPRERYASAEVMQEELEVLRRGSSIRQKHLRSWYWTISRKVALVSMLVALLSVVVVVLSERNATQDAQSRIPIVNKLVAEGYGCLLSTTPERLQRGLSYFQEAIKLDTGFVPAHYGIFGINVARSDLEGVRSSAKKLMELASDSAEAQVARSYQLWIDWCFQEALQTARRATALPAYTRRAKLRAQLGYGFQLLQTGQPEAALAQYRIAEKIAAELALSDPTLEHHLGHPYFAQRNFAEALRHYSRSLDLEPRHLHGHSFKARTYEEMEQFEKAIEEYQARDLIAGKDEAATRRLYDELREAARGGREGYWRKRLELALKTKEPDLYYIGKVYAHLGDKKNAYDYLEKACERRAFTQNLMFDLCWNHEDEEFQRIVKRIGLVP